MRDISFQDDRSDNDHEAAQLSELGQLGFDCLHFSGVILPRATFESAYALGDERLAAISSAVPDNQLAPCWVEVTTDDRVAFTANAGSSSISSYDISGCGALTLRDERAGDLGESGTPLDLAFARDGHYLYALDRGHARIAAFQVHRRGDLSMIEGSEDNLPEFTSGLAAY